MKVSFFSPFVDLNLRNKLLSLPLFRLSHTLVTTLFIARPDKKGNFTWRFRKIQKTKLAITFSRALSIFVFWWATMSKGDMEGQKDCQKHILKL